MDTRLSLDLGNTATAPDATVTIERDVNDKLAFKDGTAGTILLEEILAGVSIISSLAAPDGSPNPALQVDNTGQVGIGGAPTEFLDLRGESSSGIFLRIANATTNEDTGLILAGDRTWRIENDGDASIGAADHFHIFDVTAGASRFSIDTTGAIVIPGLLKVSNGIRSLHATNAAVLAQASGVNSSASFELQNDAQHWFLKIDGGDSDKFKLRDQTGGKDVLTITTAGSLGLGVTPAVKMHIQHATAGILRVESTGADSTAQVQLKNDAKQWSMRIVGASNDAFVIRSDTDGVDVFTIDPAQGKLTMSAGTAAGGTLLALSAGLDSVVSVEVQNDARHWIMKVDGGDLDKYIIRDETAAQDRLIITSAGTVIIPGDIVGNSQISSEIADGAAIIAKSAGADSTSTFRLLNDVQEWNIAVDGSDSDKFKILDITAVAERFTIDTAGLVTVKQDLQVDGDATSTGSFIANYGDGIALGFSATEPMLKGDAANQVLFRTPNDAGFANILVGDIFVKSGNILSPNNTIVLNLSGADATFGNDLTVDGVVKGSTCWIHAGRVTVPQMNNSGEGMDVETITMTGDKSFVMHQNGSVIWVSCAYDVTARTAGLRLNIGVAINGSLGFLSAVDDALATGKWAKATQARGLTTFVAEDRITPIMAEDLTFNVTVANVIMTMGVVFNA